MRELWFDRRHTGALRVVDVTKKVIHGADPSEKEWTVSFVETKRKGEIEVDFGEKRTHHGKKTMVARYMKHRNELHWSDGNVWLRIRSDPLQLLLQHMQ